MPKVGHHPPNSPQVLSVLQQLNTAIVDPDRIISNSKGVTVSKEELDNAFGFLDVDDKGTINLNTLRRSLSVFFPDISLRDLKFLMNDSRDLTVDDLWELLENNEITNFDPVAEAYSVYDLEGRGSLDVGKLNDMFASFGFGEISSHEMELLHNTADMDGDGVVSLLDFRMLLESSKNQPTSKNLTRKYERNADMGSQNIPDVGEYRGNIGHSEDKIKSISEVHSFVKLHEEDEPQSKQLDFSSG